MKPIRNLACYSWTVLSALECAIRRIMALSRIRARVMAIRWMCWSLRHSRSWRAQSSERALGLLQMNDESGVDAKLIAAPLDHICPATAYLKTIDDVPAHLKEQIQFFFTHYKALEKGKWVNVGGWQGVEAAHREILDGIENFR